MTESDQSASIDWKMKNGHQMKKEQVDKILKDVIKADRLRSEEVNGIASAPHLLASIRARIQAESMAMNASMAVVPVRGFGWSLVAAPAAAMALAALLGLYFVTMRFNEMEKVYIAPPPLDAEETAPLPEELDYPAPTARPRAPAQRLKNVEVQQVMLRKKTKPQPAARKVKRTVHVPLEFYALAGAGDPTDVGRDARIVRVEMPRASLLAMGVNIPIEGESPVVRTDLLLGSDGMAKAIRLVE